MRSKRPHSSRKWDTVHRPPVTPPCKKIAVFISTRGFAILTCLCPTSESRCRVGFLRNGVNSRFDASVVSAADTRWRRLQATRACTASATWTSARRPSRRATTTPPATTCPARSAAAACWDTSATRATRSIRATRPTSATPATAATWWTTSPPTWRRPAPARTTGAATTATRR